jgi:beta-carotene hydroxylase
MSGSAASKHASESGPNGRRNDPRWQQIRSERAIAAPFMNRLELRVVLESLWSVGGWAAAGVAGVAGWAPYWVTIPIASFFAYCAYMPLHEATHGNVHGRNPRFRWLNSAAGHLSSIPLLLDFPGHRMSHMAHHAFTNDENRDPDFIYAGSIGRVTAVSALTGTLNTLTFGIAAWIPPLRRMIVTDLERSLETQAVRAVRFSRAFQTLALLTMLAIAVAGYPVEVLLFWFVPAQLAIVMLGLVFAWLPHHPHNAHGRYTNTRATLFPFSGLIARGHDRHIVHHMIPSIPHYRIPAVFDKLRPILEERGTRIEGRGAGPRSAPVFLGSDPDDVSAIEKDAARYDALPFASHPPRL